MKFWQYLMKSLSLSSLLAVSPQYALRGTSSAVFSTASRVWHLLSWSRSRGVPCPISWVTNPTQTHITFRICPRKQRNVTMSYSCLFSSLLFLSFLSNTFRSPQVPPACLTLCSCSRPHSWSTLLPRTDCVPPLTPHHSAYTTATSTSQAWEENSEYLSSSWIFFFHESLQNKSTILMLFDKTSSAQGLFRSRSGAFDQVRV